MDLIEKPAADVSPQLLEAIRTLPLRRELEHCGANFFTSALDFYAHCPRCGVQIKVRSCSAVPEIEDVFDAVVEWMLRPSANEIVQQRQREIAADQDQ